jgi:hypothetical protein
MSYLAWIVLGLVAGFIGRRSMRFVVFLELKNGSRIVGNHREVSRLCRQAFVHLS